MNSLKSNIKGLMMSSALKSCLLNTSTATAIALASANLIIPAQAQEITSSIRGSVSDSNGIAIKGAIVTVIHKPSGSRSTYTTNSKGAFFSRGLRPGGPYSVEIRYPDGRGGQIIENIRLQVSEPLPLKVTLAAAQTELEEIVATGQQLSSTNQGGGATSYGADQIANAASISRDFKDIIRFNPFVDINGANGDAVSISGSNNRMNSLSVDGIRQDDDFGLNGSGNPTQRAPISIDAIEQIGVNIAPYNVEFGRFTGGSLNVVTKSGTNEYHGSTFFEYSDGSLTGNKSKDTVVDLGDFTEKFYGATLGGPIIKDKLFFFGSYEKFKGSSVSTFGGEGSGASNIIRGVTQADIDEIGRIALERYGHDVQNLDKIPEQDEKFFIKIDWNINDDHRAFFSYQRTTGNEIRIEDTRTGGRYGSISHWYNRSEKLTAYNFQLFSDWSDNLSTEIKVGRKLTKTGQNTLSDPGFGEVRISTRDSNGNRGTVYIGADDSRHANRLSNNTWQVKAKADYLLGNHTITAGYELDSLDVFNLFIQRALGQWRFRSVDDFRNGKADRISYQNAASHNPEDAAANFNITVHTFYLQDVWDVTDKLTLTGGLRFDVYKQSKSPVLNQNFVDRNGFDNTSTLDGNNILQPRFGFSYTVDDVTTVRGGVGLFAGGDPNVWISNSFSIDGTSVLVSESRRGRSSEDLSILDNVTEFNKIPQPLLDGLVPGRGNVAATDPNFHIPSTWKFNLAVDRYFDFGPLGDNWHLSLEAIWSRVNYAADWKELRRSLTDITAADGSPIYDRQSGYDLLLTNTRDGKTDSYAFSFDKAWDDISIFGSYTYNNSESVQDGTSSTAESNFNFPAYIDRNNRLSGTSPFEIKHNIKLGLTYRKAFWDENYTTVSLFYNGRSGRAFSITASGCDAASSFFCGQGYGGNSFIDSGQGHLIYIPEVGEAGFSYVDQAAFDTWVKDNGFLRGQYISKGSERAPWVNQMDMRISQEVPFVFGKFEAFMALENVLNFLGSSGGRVEESQFSTQRILETNVDKTTGEIEYGIPGEPNLTFRDNQSVWKIQFGIKYKF